MDNFKKYGKVTTLCILIILSAYFLCNYIFLKNDNDNDKKEDTNIYEANQYKPIKITDEDMANKYLNDFKNTVLSNKDEAYKLLNKDYRETKFQNIEEFYTYINNLQSMSFYSLKVDKYEIKTINNKKIFYILGSDGNMYYIKENHIMDYEVYLDNYIAKLQ